MTQTDGVELSGFERSIVLIFCVLTGIAVCTYIGGLIRDTAIGNVIAPAVDLFFILFVYLPLVTVGLVGTELLGIDPPNSEPLGTALATVLLLIIYYVIAVFLVNSYRISVAFYIGLSNQEH
ncbi:hypothetical protein [Halalkalicoccus tibetensis]|uniref:Uncharacterized protein n=1 Tax=Halalkalicoccus tibetensis TaxID=175632 RepID=A0ABD5UY65_9EURY